MPSALRSSVAVGPGTRWVADGVERGTVTVTARDSDGQPLVGHTVRVAMTGERNTVEQSASPTDAAGKAVAQVSSLGSGTKYVSAVINPDGPSPVVLPSQIMVTFIAGALAPELSTITLDNTQAVADGVAKIRITTHLVDAQGNGIPLLGVTANVTGGGTTLTPALAYTNSAGVAELDLSATQEGEKTVVVSSEGTVVGTPQTVTFLPAPPPPDAGPCNPANPAEVPLPPLTGPDGGYVVTLESSELAQYEGLIRAHVLYELDPLFAADILVCAGDWENPAVTVSMSGHHYSWSYTNPEDAPVTGSIEGVVVMPTFPELEDRLRAEVRNNARIRIWGFNVDRITYPDGHWLDNGGVRFLMVTHMCVDPP